MSIRRCTYMEKMKLVELHLARTGHGLRHFELRRLRCLTAACATYQPVLARLERAHHCRCTGHTACWSSAHLAVQESRLLVRHLSFRRGHLRDQCSIDRKSGKAANLARTPGSGTLVLSFGVRVGRRSVEPGSRIRGGEMDGRRRGGQGVGEGRSRYCSSYCNGDVKTPHLGYNV